MDAKPLHVVFLDIDGVLNSERYVRTRPAEQSEQLWTADDLDPESVAIDVERLVAVHLASDRDLPE